MDKLLRFFLILAAVSALFAAPVRASHLQGGDLTYASLGNNQYRVTLHVYRDCSGIQFSPFTLECRAGGCNAAAVVTAPFVQVGPASVGRQYCATLSGICTGTGPANSEAYTFAATVTLPPAAHWVLSTIQSARPVTTNLAGNGGNLYLEATLNNLVPRAGSSGTVITNNSPVASALPVSFVPVHQNSVLSNSAFDVDGDSLVYSLDRPLDFCGSPAAYAAYPMPATSTLGPGCYLQGPVASTYISDLPVFVDNDTLGTCPLKTAVPRFGFNPRTGSISLSPARYLNTASALGDNKYAAVVKITEYRRVNGAYAEVGTMRRELYLVVYDCGTNVMPRMAPAVTVQLGTRSTTQPLNQIIPVVAGEPVSVVLTATDANAGQALTLTLDYNATPGTALQNLGGGQARLTYTPALNLPDGLYRVAVTAEDNACPIKGLETQVVTFRVSGAPLATRSAAPLAVAAFPNPFTGLVQFQLATPGMQTLTIYDNLGRLVAAVRSQADGTVRWQPAPELPAGLYLARTADGLQTVRLLRQAGI